MPDRPPDKRRPQAEAVALPGDAPRVYAELHAKTNFTFLTGASHPDELVVRAAELGYAALAITDRNSLAGIVRAHSAAKSLNLKLLVGAELTLVDAPPIVVWATDRAAYGRLARTITLGRRRMPKGECELRFDDLAEHAEGLIAGILDPSPEERETPDDLATLVQHWQRYRELFGDRCYALAERHLGPDDRHRFDRWRYLSRQTRVPLVAAGDVYYHDPSRAPLQDVLTAIRTGTQVVRCGAERFANAERHLKPVEDLQLLFSSLPGAVQRTLEIADRCPFSLDELRYEYPEELCPAGQTPSQHLRRLTYEGARGRYPDGLPPRVRELLEHELRLIDDLHYEAYFLTVWDLVRFARSRGILCQGRGSAANSAVCYCLGITSVDPSQLDVLFERFVSRERNEAPDIDVDFEHERREEVLQYVYDKYGRERAGITAEVITYRPRSAVRDVGKALGMSLDRVDALAKVIDSHGIEPQLDARCREAGLDPQSPVVRQWLDLVGQIQGFPRHLSQHVGGMVMTQGPLCELVPIENAAMPGRTVIQWDKDDLDTLGILKVDCLALGMLTAIHRCFDLVAQHAQRRLTLANIPPADRRVYDMISRADTMGVFQIESRAQMSMLPRLRPRCFYDLVIEVAIVRPGPIQGDMVHPYLRRRAGLEPIDYPNEAIREVLHKTLGVPIFQEQAMRLAIVAAGFTPGEADQLRRAMGAWRRSGVIEPFRERLVSGMRERGLPEEFALRVFDQLKGFGEYGFPESHAASFALLVYVSAWLKHYYPAAFTAALLNSQPMGFYAPAQLVRDARRQGVEVRPPDVNHSTWDCTLEEVPRSSSKSHTRNAPANPWALRLGLRMIRGLAEAQAQRIERARAEGPFRSTADLARRTGLGRGVLNRLARADAFGSLELNRRAALWQTLGHEAERPLFAGLEQEDEPADALPSMPAFREVALDYQTAGLSLRPHPLSFLRPQLDQLKAVRARQLATLPFGQYVRVAGLVLLRQRPGTAKGITFVTIEDETGDANLIVRADVWERFHHVARTAKAFLAHGRLERQGSVIHVVVSKLEDLSHLLAEVQSRTRDFR